MYRLTLVLKSKVTEIKRYTNNNVIPNITIMLSKSGILGWRLVSHRKKSAGVVELTFQALKQKD